MRLELRYQREIARLHFKDPSRSSREIAKSVDVSPNSVLRMRAQIHAAARTWTQLKDLNDDDWQKVLKTEDHSIAQRKAVPKWEDIHKEMQRPDATLEALWREFKEDCPDGAAFTQFSNGYRAWRTKLNIVMRQVHRPGEKLFVDYAGRTVTITNQIDGTTWQAQIFVGVLGCSNLTQIEAVATQTIPDWITCHVHCFEFIGGAPEWVVCDRLKAAVLRTQDGCLVITPAYREALKHYDTASLPAGPRKPKHKAKAEVGVQIAQRWILFRLRDRVFFSLEELNVELRRLRDELNNHPFKKLPGTRRSRFDEMERGALKPLPSTPYEFCDWRYKVLVGPDYHVEHQRCYYSVPFHLQRQTVDLRITAKAIEVMHRGNRVALHDRLFVAGEVRTSNEHRPVQHVRVLEGEPRALAAWAQSVGPSTARMIEFHLTLRSDRTNGLRAARRMRELAKEYGEQRFEEVCTYALPLNMTALRSVTSILKESADKRSKAPVATTPPTTHAHVRGPDYFGDDE